MSVHRLYFLRNDKIIRFEEIDAAYDAAAIRIADALRGQAAELWQTRRRVAKLAELASRPAGARATSRPATGS